MRSNHLQDQLYKTLFESDIMDLLLVVAQHAGVSVTVHFSVALMHAYFPLLMRCVCPVLNSHFCSHI